MTAVVLSIMHSTPLHSQLHNNLQVELKGMVVRLAASTAKCHQMWVGMVQMYSGSANVNDQGFAWTGWPPSLHGPALLLVPIPIMFCCHSDSLSDVILAITTYIPPLLPGESAV